MLKDTKAFVEMVKLSTVEPDLKQIAVFFPDALLIPDEDYRSEEFGKGLFILLHTDPYRFSRIVECHVTNYNVLGYRLIKESPVPEGKLAGMFILSIAIKNAGRELFNELPPSSYFKEILDAIKRASPENVEEVFKKIPTYRGVKEQFAELISPLFYWNEYKKSVKEMDSGHFYAFLAHINSIFSAFYLLTVIEKRGLLKKKTEEKKLTLQGAAGSTTLKVIQASR